LLTRHGFPVPPGFIITAPAYREFMAGAEDLFAVVNHFPYHDPAKMELESARLLDQISRLSLPASVAAEVRMRLADFPSGQAFSVRSSSTMEDLASPAFAGQHETFLSCSGESQILGRIKGCFLSLWSASETACRQPQGFGPRLAA